MAYLKWSWSPWYAYSHVDGGEGDDALLVAWHASGPRFDATAGELRDAGCERRPEGLLAYMEQRAPKLGAQALRDADALCPAVDEFLFEVYNAGKIPMPRDLARRVRTLRRLVKRAVNRPGRDNAVDARGFPMWFVWTGELNEINRQYPPPRVPQEWRHTSNGCSPTSARASTSSHFDSSSGRLNSPRPLRHRRVARRRRSCRPPFRAQGRPRRERCRSRVWSRRRRSCPGAIASGARRITATRRAWDAMEACRTLRGGVSARSPVSRDSLPPACCDGTPQGSRTDGCALPMLPV